MAKDTWFKRCRKRVAIFCFGQVRMEIQRRKTFGMKSMIRKRKLSNKKTIKEKVVVTYNQKYAMREKIRRNGALEYANKLTKQNYLELLPKKVVKDI